MSIVSNASSSSESSAEPDPNLLDRWVDNEDALSNVSDLAVPTEDRYREDEFYVPDVSDKNWTYGDLGQMAEQTSASFLPDLGCSTHLRQHGIVLDSTPFSGSSVLDSFCGAVDTNNFWEEHDSFDQFLKSSEFRQSSKPEDPISSGSKLQARIIYPSPRRPASTLMPKSKACEGFLKRIMKRAKRVRSWAPLPPLRLLQRATKQIFLIVLTTFRTASNLSIDLDIGLTTFRVAPPVLIYHSLETQYIQSDVWLPISYLVTPTMANRDILLYKFIINSIIMACIIIFPTDSMQQVEPNLRMMLQKSSNFTVTTRQQGRPNVQDASIACDYFGHFQIYYNIWQKLSKTIQPTTVYRSSIVHLTLWDSTFLV